MKVQTKKMMASILSLLMVFGLWGTVYASTPGDLPEEIPIAESEEFSDDGETDESEDILPDADVFATETTVDTEEKPTVYSTAFQTPSNLNEENDGVANVYTAADLRAAFAGLETGDTLDVVLHNDIYIGDGSKVSYNSGKGDGDTDPLTISKSDVTVNFQSPTPGTKHTIYRVDAERHLVIVGTTYAPLTNVTLTFADIELNGLKQYDPLQVVSNEKYDSSGGGINVVRAENFKISGAQIRNCLDASFLNSDRSNGYNGGAIMFQIIRGATIENCIFEDNVSAGLGGALDFLSSSDIVIQNSVFRRNASARPGYMARGGAISIGGVGSSGQYTIDSCEFTENFAKGYLPSGMTPDTASGGDYGGAISIDTCEASLLIKGDTVIQGNTANLGGAVYFNGTDSMPYGDFVVEGDVKILNNNAYNDHAVFGSVDTYNHAYGGGFFVGSRVLSLQIKDGVVFEGNSATAINGGGYGGGIMTMAPVEISGEAWFTNNTCVGSAIANYGGGMYFNNTAEVSGDVLFEENVACRGGAVFAGVQQTKPGRFIGTVFQNNRAVLDPLLTSAYNGSGGAVYMSSYLYLYCEDTSFSGNWAEGGAYYLEPDEPEYLSQENYETFLQYDALFMPGVKSLSWPFDLAQNEFAYNNYDVYFTMGTPIPVITVEYYRRNVDGTAVPIDTVLVDATRRMNTLEALQEANINEAGALWRDAFKPEDCFDGEVVSGAMPELVGKQNFTVRIEYLENEHYGVVLTVQFETNGGSAVPSVEVPYGQAVLQPEVPTKEGFDFAGWYADEQLAEKWEFETPVTESMTLYAAWTEKIPVKPNPNPEPAPTVKPTGTGDTTTPWWSVPLVSLLGMLSVASIVKRKKNDRQL